MSSHFNIIFQHLVILVVQIKIISGNSLGVTAIVGGSEDEENSAIPTKVPSTPPINYNTSLVNDPDVSPTIPTEAFLEAKNGPSKIFFRKKVDIII